MDYIKGPDGITRPIIDHVHIQDEAIASLKTQVRELQSSLRAIELRLAPIEMERRRYC